jgi:hypothetical protein
MARLFRRAATRARRALTVPGVIIAVVVAGVLGSPAIAQAAVGAAGSSASTAQHTSTAQQASTAQHTSTAQQASTAQQGSTAGQATATQPAATGGICGVPGIGDIGGLLGFCNAGSSGIIGDLNNICQPSIPAPEPANGGIDSLIQPRARRRPRCMTAMAWPASPGPPTTCSART